MGVGTHSPRLASEPSARRPVPLLWRVFGANGVVLAFAFAVLAVAPLAIHVPIRLDEAVILLGALIAMLLANLLLLRQVLSPLGRLARAMASADLLRPGQRATGFERASSEVVALADAFNGMLERLEHERRESSARALAAQESERLRVARELHDEVGQSLTAVALRAERAAGRADDGVGEDLIQLAEIVQLALRDVRRISRELRPEALDELGLRGALVALCGRVAGQSGMRVEHRLEGRLPRLSEDVELAIYRIAQEALTNAIRHSGAGTVTVSLERRGEGLTLTVADDGRGLAEETPDGGGLTGMRERALLVGGELRIESVPGAGTTVELTLQCPPR